MLEVETAEWCFETCIELLIKDAVIGCETKVQVLQCIVYDSRDRSWTFPEVVAYYMRLARPKEFKQLCLDHARRSTT